MPKKAKELSALEVKRLISKGLHFVGEVPGLALQVLPTGGRTWILRVVIAGKRRDIGLGGYPEVSLADARSKARTMREQLRSGVDPLAEVRAARSELRASATAFLTFRQAAEKYLESQRPGWRNPKHAAQWESTLAQYAMPVIGDLSVADVKLAHVLAILEQPAPLKPRGSDGAVGKFWEVRTETATRLRGRIESILDWAKGRGHRSGDNPAAWKGNLDAQLARPERIKRVEHRRAVAVEAIAGFIAQLHQQEGVAAKALQFAIFCAARSGEVRGMRWGELNLASRMWTVPAERMKAGREHRVPLSDAAIALLESLPRFDGTDLVFPSPRGKGCLSDMTLTAVMRRMGRTEVPHGFRSTFRDWAGECTHYPGDMAEMALAHVITSSVEAAYRRRDMLEKRRQMMNDWAEYCLNQCSGSVSGERANPVQA